ncbi:Mth938-like domain-containing protein [Thiohalobacter sp. IOR34]|uniref:Mth938-like domain-containing protein n=1 Tax=Thiohalobacter sp. IOR34 TaxID=3057176 RepID=UPI0025AF3788|nr:Mth938-like domain-containing protein [Thiohalobacter sp. IOR34]WJW74414.1 Mth938-like domain-containing protein [Thiohalobacter sp. IOR34]
MRFAEDQPGSAYAIRAYEAGRIRVGEQELTRSLVLSPERLQADWPPQDFDALRSEHLASLVAWQPEVLLLGTGPRLRFPEPALLRPLIEQGIGLEVMDTAAACRTYNILLAEGRRVVAALFMI